MKTIILAGGVGSRISEESHLRPKPMIEIGEKPILWHIMKIYSHYGFQDFIMCLGYKAYYVKEYFANYFLHESDVTFDFGRQSEMEVHNHTAEAWRVTLVNTGVNTMTGSRIKKVQHYVGKETFMLTYGDGVGNINIPELLKFHRAHGKLATVTAVQPGGRFGALNLDDQQVTGFKEKPTGDGNWINGGFFVLEPQVFDYISSGTESCVFEREPLEALSREGQLMAYPHSGFWQPMDTLRDKNQLEELWRKGDAPWKVWNENTTTELLEESDCPSNRSLWV